VVESSKKLVNVFLLSTQGKSTQELWKKYGVNSAPTVIFVDTKGKELGRMGDRSPEGLKRQIEDVAAKSGGSFDSWDKAVAVAKKADKPVLYLFTTSGKDSQAMEEALADDVLEKARSLVVIVKAANKSDNPDAKKFGVVGLEQPVLLVLDPSAEKPEAAPLKKIVGKKSAKELLKELESIPKPKKQ
jgi:hypothetical protein